MQLLQAFNMTTGEVVEAINKRGNKQVKKTIKKWILAGDKVEIEYYNGKEGKL